MADVLLECSEAPVSQALLQENFSVTIRLQNVPLNTHHQRCPLSAEESVAARLVWKALDIVRTDEAA